MKDSERMVVSAYFDGEVEAPWKAQVERKLAENPEWAAEAAALKQLREALAASPQPAFGAQQRIFEAVSRTRTVRRLPLGWLSAAAAALLVVAASGGYWYGRQSAAAVEVAEIQVQVPRQLELKLSGEGQLLMASTLQGNRR